MSEQHEKQFRGCWLSPEVMELIEEKTISCKEAVLLMVIDSLCKHSGPGCYASNQWLGDKVGVKPTQTKAMIQHLKKLGILKQIRFTGRKRYLQTAGKPTSRQPGNRLADSRETTPLDIREIKRPSQAQGPDSETSSEKKKTWDSKTLKGHPRWRHFASQLASTIANVRKIRTTARIPQWAEDFRKLYKTDKVPLDRIRAALDWYCKQVEENDLIRYNPNFVPVAYSGSAFRKKFLRIEDARHRADHPRNTTGEEPLPKMTSYKTEGEWSTEQMERFLATGSPDEAT